MGWTREYYDRDGNRLPGPYGATFMYRVEKTTEEEEWRSGLLQWTRLPVPAEKG